MSEADFLRSSPPPPVPATGDMNGPARYVNRELSWLGFNWRVLEEAENPAVPLLERLRFLSISATNLDEFYTVPRLQACASSPLGTATSPPPPDGLTPAEQLDLNRRRGPPPDAAPAGGADDPPRRDGHCPHGHPRPRGRDRRPMVPSCARSSLNQVFRCSRRSRSTPRIPSPSIPQRRVRAGPAPAPPQGRAHPARAPAGAAPDRPLPVAAHRGRATAFLPLEELLLPQHRQPLSGLCA